VLLSGPDEVWEIRHGEMLRYSEPITEIIPERDAEFATSVHQAEEGIATIASGVAVSAAADLALNDVTANVALRAVVCSGISGLSSTVSNSALLACSRCNRRSSVTKHVRRRKMRSKRARISLRRRAVGAAQ
jgi:hypothetical protein